MIVDLTPETFFDSINQEGPLHVVMHYGETCGPCKITMPHYEILEQHFSQYDIKNVKFYRFHHWQPEYKPFIEENNLKTNGVPTFRYYYMGEKLHEVTASYKDPNDMKKVVMEVIEGIEQTMGSFDLYVTTS
jgi:thiol-disulfide isomerase/thioredoxin